MAGESTTPILPCGSIEETGDFYEMLGFSVTYRQQRPNPYLVVRREDIELHFAGIPGFDPEQSYGSCLVSVPDIDAFHRSLARAMRDRHGRVLASGIPRMTRPRRRKNTGKLSGFSVVDPGGNWVRIFEQPDAGGDVEEPEPAVSGDGSAGPESGLARTLRNAVVLGESKGDPRQAARSLDTALRKAGDEDDTPVTDLAEALVYRAELALALDDPSRAADLLARLHGLPLTRSDRETLHEALANAESLGRDLHPGPY